MKIFALLCFLLFASSSMAQKMTDNSDGLVTVIKEKYTFQYPISWAIDTSKTFGMEVLLRSPKTDSLDDFNENMNLFVQSLSGQGYSLTQMGQESESQLRNVISEIQIVESRLDSAAAPQCYILKYKGRHGKFVITTIQHYYLKDEVGYALTMSIKEGKEKDYIPIADRIFTSFHFR